MSYDLVFLAKTPEQSWGEALEAAEERLEHEDEQGGLLDPAVWAGVLAGVREILGSVDISVGDSFVQLVHEPTGISVMYSPDEVDVSVPYWTRGDAARQIVDVIYRLAAIVERETGLPGYDPQMDMPVADAAVDIDLVNQSFGTGAALLGERARAQRIELPS